MRTTIALVATFLTTVATLLAQLEGDDELWSAQLHARPRLARLGSRRRAEYV
jgi:hypothetical protein